jgi:hypothetical protein
MGILVLILAGYMLLFGALPLGRFPYIGRSMTTGSDAWSSRGDMFFRIAGGALILGWALPDAMLDAWMGQVVLGGLGLLFIFIGIIASLSGRAL